MPMTLDATLKDMGRDSPVGFLTEFDQPPAGPTKLLNVDLSTVTTAADLIVGIGEPLTEIIHLEFQSVLPARNTRGCWSTMRCCSATTRCPCTPLCYCCGRKRHMRTWTARLRTRRGRRMVAWLSATRSSAFGSASAEQLLAADLGVAPLAVLGRLPEGMSLEDGLGAVAKRLVERVTKEASPERAKKLLMDALLLTGLRVRRDVAAKIFRGVRAMQESDTYLMIVDEGREKSTRKIILGLGTDRFGAPDEAVKARLSEVTDVDRLERIALQIPKCANWHEALDTP